jgi:putative transposase
MDLFTREIVGWSLSNRHTKDLVINAFFDVFKNSGKRPEIIHSDQGVESCSKEYQKLMAWLGVKISMSKKSSPWENGYQESFFNNFKTDLGLEFDRFNGIGEQVETVHQQIRYYNQERIQTTLKMPPTKFKQLYYQNQCTLES